MQCRMRFYLKTYEILPNRLRFYQSCIRQNQNRIIFHKKMRFYQKRMRFYQTRYSYTNLGLGKVPLTERRFSKINGSVR